jgi:hypothetical protein
VTIEHHLLIQTTDIPRSFVLAERLPLWNPRCTVAQPQHHQSTRRCLPSNTLNRYRPILVTSSNAGMTSTPSSPQHNIQNFGFSSWSFAYPLIPTHSRFSGRRRIEAPSLPSVRMRRRLRVFFLPALDPPQCSSNNYHDRCEQHFIEKFIRSSGVVRYDVNLGC